MVLSGSLAPLRGFVVKLLNTSWMISYSHMVDKVLLVSQHRVRKAVTARLS